MNSPVTLASGTGRADTAIFGRVNEGSSAASSAAGMDSNIHENAYLDQNHKHEVLRVSSILARVYHGAVQFILVHPPK
jgi:hypothetical protein